MFLFIFALKTPEQLAVVMDQVAGGGYVGDLLGILVIIATVMIYGFLLDPHNMLINLMATYIAFLVVIFSPMSNLGWLSDLQVWIAELILLGGSIVVISILLSATHLFRIVYVRNFFVRWWKAGISGLLYGGLLVSILLSFLPDNFLTQFSPGFIKMFLGSWQRLWWMTAPVIGLFFIRYKRKSRVSY